MIDAIMEKAKVRLAQNDDAHGYHHAERVFHLGEEIRTHEGGDPMVIAASSYMHDWCSFKGRTYHVSDGAMKEIRADLEAMNFPADKIGPVVEAIRHHEDYDFRKKRKRLSKECQILQDADRLDALGAIGIGRCFYTTATLNFPFGTPDEMERLDEDYHIGQITSAVQHFYTKLLHLKDAMNTEYAKSLAQRRHDFMIEFLNRLKLEWTGKI